MKLIKEEEEEDYGYAKFTDTIDTLIIGRKTYDYVLKEISSSNYNISQRDVYVITRAQRPSVGQNNFYMASLIELAQRLKAEKYLQN